jgi:hypothetical protein
MGEKRNNGVARMRMHERRQGDTEPGTCRPAGASVTKSLVFFRNDGAFGRAAGRDVPRSVSILCSDAA